MMTVSGGAAPSCALDLATQMLTNQCCLQRRAEREIVSKQMRHLILKLFGLYFKRVYLHVT